MDILIVSGVVILVIAIAAYLVLHHQDFQETEVKKTYYRQSINENAYGGQLWSRTETRAGRDRTSVENHRHTPKQITVLWSKTYKNC